MHLHCDLKRVISTLIRTAAVMAALASPLVATATPSRVTVNVNDTDLVALQLGIDDAGFAHGVANHCVLCLDGSECDLGGANRDPQEQRQRDRDLQLHRARGR